MISPELLQRFQFRFRNWDSMSVNHPPFLTEPFCLSREDHEFLVRTVERLHPLVTKARQGISKHPEQMKILGLDTWTQEAISQELKSADLEAGIEIARYDFFKTTHGDWKISEINNDVPSGFNESSFMHEMAQQSWPDITNYEVPTPVTDHFVTAFQRKKIRNLAMLYGTAYSEDLQICLFLKDALQDPSFKGTLASPAHLKVSRDKAMIWDQEVDAVYRIYPVEWFSALPNRDEWVKVLRLKNFKLINPLSTIISQSKNFFSVLQAQKSELLSPLIPYTEPFCSDKLTPYFSEKDRWVLKPVFGRMGYDIAIGKLLTAEQWQRALQEAAKKPGEYCIQEFFEIAPTPFSLANCYLCIGVFVINNRFAGYFTRASLTPLTTYEAMDVTTVIELS